MGVPARLLVLALAGGALSFAAVAVAFWPDAAPALSEPFEPTPAPDVTIAGSRGPFRLAAERGRPVVLQFAPADSVEAWAALAQAYTHFEAVGARVLGVTTDGDAPESPFDVGRDPGAHAAEAFGYDGRPLAVVVDASGRVRGHASPRDAAALFALAAPVLVEELAPAAGASEAEASPRVVIDVRPAAQRDAEGAFPHAVVADASALSARDLPADLAVALVFVGPDAEAAAARARAWGYDDIETVSAAGVGEAGVAVPENGSLDAAPAPPRSAGLAVRG